MSRCHPLPISHFSSHLWQCMPALVPETTPVSLISTVKSDTHMSYWTLFFRLLPGNAKKSDLHEACHFPGTELSCVLHMAARCADTPSLGSCSGWQPLNNLVCHHCCLAQSGVWSRGAASWRPFQLRCPTGLWLPPALGNYCSSVCSIMVFTTNVSDNVFIVSLILTPKLMTQIIESEMRVVPVQDSC